MHVSPSIGISVYPQDGSEAETLLGLADIAMERARAHLYDSVAGIPMSPVSSVPLIDHHLAPHPPELRDVDNIRA